MLVIEYYVGNRVEASNLGILGSRNFFFFGQVYSFSYSLHCFSCWQSFFCLAIDPEILFISLYDKSIFSMQRIRYAKTKSDIIAKADGTFVPRERRKRHEEKGKPLSYSISRPLGSAYITLFCRVWYKMEVKVNTTIT